MTLNYQNQLPHFGIEQSDGSLQIREILNIPVGQWTRPNYEGFTQRVYQPEHFCAAILFGLLDVDGLYNIIKKQKKDAEDIQKIGGPIEKAKNIVDGCNDVLSIFLSIREMIDNGIKSKRLHLINHSVPSEQDVIDLLNEKFLFRPYYYFEVKEFLSWASQNGFQCPTFLEKNITKSETIKNKNFEEFIKHLKIYYENNSEINIQIPKRKKNCVTANTLGFTNPNGITWEKLLRVLQDPPHYHYVLDTSKINADRNRLKQINDKLLTFITEKFNINPPDKYKLYELAKEKGPGVYRFKFKIMESETIDRPNPKLKKDFFKSATKLNQNPNDTKLKDRVYSLAAKGIDEGWLTNKDVDSVLDLSNLGKSLSKNITADNLTIYNH